MMPGSLCWVWHHVLEPIKNLLTSSVENYLRSLTSSLQTAGHHRCVITGELHDSRHKALLERKVLSFSCLPYRSTCILSIVDIIYAFSGSYEPLSNVGEVQLKLWAIITIAHNFPGDTKAID